MRTITSYALSTISAVLGLGIIYFTFNAYFIFSVVDGYYFDGLGRELYNSPWWLSWIVGDTQFPGIKWFFIDLVAFWASVGILFGLLSVSVKLRE